jgi:cyclopropane-fatty-acyl-phospholipid synthase
MGAQPGELIEPSPLCAAYKSDQKPGESALALRLFTVSSIGIKVRAWTDGELDAVDQETAVRVKEGILGNLIVRIGKRLLPKTLKGSLELTLPSGKQVVLGTPGEGFTADLTLRNFKVIWASVRRAQLGFFESYMAGDIESRDPTKIFQFYLNNRAALDRAAIGIFSASWFDKLWHRARDNNTEGSKENISAHYDLGNNFYKLWLDETMTYSSAVFDRTGNSLEAAQRHKYAKVMEALELKKGDHILEIGSGWGGFAEEAARKKAMVKGITLSREQLAFAEERIAKAGLDSRASFHFEDYRDTKGSFNGIASIEMIEAVGEPHWPVYFRTLYDRLKPGGIAAIQGITISEANYEAYRSGVDFIQRYIFPGGMLLTKTILKEQAAKAGLILERAETFGQSYATTLRLWHERFETVWPEVAKLGFDEKFRRLWKLYLAYCEAGFAESVVDVGIYKLRKPA